MIKLKIGPAQKDLDDVDQNWVHEMIRNLRAAGEPVCVIVTIEEYPINIILSTKECNHRGTGLANFNENEKRIIELWNKHLGDDKIVPGRLIAFLSQIEKLV